MTRGAPPAWPSWPHRAAVVLAASTALLLAVGGLVTTYRAGMAVVDWPTTFGHSMFAYPLDRMLESWGVAVEHSHRMLASIVGLVTMALVLTAHAGAGRTAAVSAWLAVLVEVALVGVVLAAGTVGGALQAGLLGAVAGLLLVAAAAPGPRRGTRALASAVHLAVVGQGLLGGTRVLENSQHLAFLHGAAAQAVAALVVANVVVTGRGWAHAPGGPGTAERPSLRGLAWLAAAAGAVVYGQIVLGAWLRHSGAALPLVLHVAAALVTVGVVLLLARRLESAAEATGARPLAALRRLLLATLFAQVALGVLVLLAILVLGNGFQGLVTVTEAVTASLHVLVGALLLGGCVAAAMWSARLGGARERLAGAPVLEGGAA